MGSLRSLRSLDRPVAPKKTVMSKPTPLPQITYRERVHTDGFVVEWGDFQVSFSTIAEAKTFMDRLLVKPTIYHMRADIYEKGKPLAYLIKKGEWKGFEYRRFHMELLRNTISSNPQLWAGILDFNPQEWEIRDSANNLARAVADYILTWATKQASL